MPQHALVVDDDLETCKLIQAILHSADMEALISTASAEAVELLRNQKFDAVFLDVNMPLAHERLGPHQRLRQSASEGRVARRPQRLARPYARPANSSDRHNVPAVKYFAHLPGQCSWRERLLQKCQARIQHSMPHDGVICVTGNVEHPHFRADRGKVSGQLRPDHSRHNHVGEHQVDRTQVIFTDTDRLRRGLRRKDRITDVFQAPLRHAEQRYLVFNNKNRLRTPFYFLYDVARRRDSRDGTDTR